MTRYIDADALMDELNTEWYADAEKRMQGVGDAISICGMNRAFAVMRLFDAPTADVVEVVHARWKNDMNCSACGYLYDTGEYTNAKKFCPYCGAKMDADSKDVSHE